MNRALPFILIAALAAGGLGYFAMQSANDPIDPGKDLPTPSPVAGANVEPRVAEPVQLTLPTQPAPRVKRKDTDGIAKSFEVIPMNALGQLLAEAQIVATQGDQEWTGTGRTKWEGVPAGEWTVKIEASDAPKWERTLTIGNGERRREAAYVCEELRIQGKIVDTYGTPAAKAQLFFLPSGIGHPTRGDLANGKSATKGTGKWATSTGAIGAMTDASGSFSAKLPNPGKWRVSIGSPDKQLWAQSKPTELTVGGADKATIVIPSKSRLTMTIADTENRPSQVSAYTFDAQLAARLDRDRMEREAVASKGADVQRQGKRLASEARIEFEKNGSLGSGKEEAADSGASERSKAAMEENARLARERRGGGVDHRPVAQSPIFDPGWRPVATARFDENGVAVLEKLPGNENIRFLFVRGRERITTAISSSLTPSARSIATVELPRPQPESVEAPRSNAASVRVELDRESESAKLEESVEWTVD